MILWGHEQLERATEKTCDLGSWIASAVGLTLLALVLWRWA